jgi:hypothetical protein
LKYNLNQYSLNVINKISDRLINSPQISFGHFFSSGSGKKSLS